MSEHFSGHDLEAGVLQRARSWRDVLPPLVMLQSLRVSGSPIYVSIWLATVIIIATLLPPGPADHVITDSNDRSEVWPLFLRGVFAHLDWPGAAWLFASVLIAMLPIAVTQRAGALYAAGRDSESLVSSLGLIKQRAWALLLVLVLPIVCVIGLAIPIALLALLAYVPGIGSSLIQWLAVLVAPFAILIGLIGAGSVVAIPIGWASIAIEKREDAFDALSRGYEYLYRRPVQTTLYLAISFLLATLLGWIAQWVAFVGAWTSGKVISSVAQGEPLPAVLRLIFVHLPSAVSLASLFALLGAAYLLLRQDANQQEIEDIAVSAIDRRKSSLPTLRDKQA